jgi:hydroxymethylpyrimidine/phosphomethylpyrimidine kinase
MIPTALTIAGSDPSGGAGLQADLKTFQQFRVYGMSVVTLITVQNTQAVTQVELLDPALVAAQLDAVVSDIPPAAAKTGALGSAAMIEVVAEAAARFDFPLVVDPVMVSKHGHALLADDAVEVLRSRLLTRAFLVTPNVAEAERLSGVAIHDVHDLLAAAEKIAALGCPRVLIKGGGLAGDPDDLYFEDGDSTLLPGERIASQNVHGSGCVMAAAITASLAEGLRPLEAVRRAKLFVTAAIGTAPGLGGGVGPTNLFTTPP